MDGLSTCKLHLDKPLYVKLEPSSTITITFCDSAENHAGMQIVESSANRASMQIIEPVSRVFTYDELIEAYNYHSFRRGTDPEYISYNEHAELELVDLTTDESRQACVLVIRNYLEEEEHSTLLDELKSLDWDKKYYSYGAVKNKQARWNLVFADDEQEPSYEDAKGRVVAWDCAPNLAAVKDRLNMEHGLNTVAEGNYYYANKCGIGYHGDRERSYVIGLRVGDPMPLSFRWYRRSAQVGETININLNGGDLYIMSEVAVGTDWLQTSYLTLRHAAGANKYVDAK